MPPSRRASDRLPPTVSSAEVARWLERHERESDRIHDDLVDLVRRLDKRTGELSTRITVIFSVVAVLWSIFLVIAPAVRSMLGLG